MFEVREVLRLWIRDESLRAIERLSGLDRKTVRRYVEAATSLGLVREAGEDQLDEVLIGSVVEAVRPPPQRRPRRRVAPPGGQPRPDQGLAGRGPS